MVLITGGKSLALRSVKHILLLTNIHLLTDLRVGQPVVLSYLAIGKIGITVQPLPVCRDEYLI